MLAQHTLNLRPALSMRAALVAVCAYAMLVFSPSAFAGIVGAPIKYLCYNFDLTWNQGGYNNCLSVLNTHVIVSHEIIRPPSGYYSANHDIYHCGPLGANQSFYDSLTGLCVSACPAGTEPDENQHCKPEPPPCPLGQYHDGTACIPKPSCTGGEHFDASAKQCVCDNGYFRAPTGHRWATQCIRQASGEDFTTHPTWPELAQTYCTGSCMILTDGNEAEVAPTIEGLPNWGSSIPLPGADSGDPDGEDGSTTPGDSAGNNGSGGSGGGGSGTTGGGAGCQPLTLPKGANYFMVVPRFGAAKGC